MNVAKMSTNTLRALRSGFIEGLEGTCNIYRDHRAFSTDFKVTRRTRKNDWAMIKKDLSLTLSRSGLIKYVHLAPPAKNRGSLVATDDQPTLPVERA